MKLSDKSMLGINLCLSFRCNFCRGTCPVYEVSQMEFDSPRARIEFVNEALQGRVKPEDIAKFLNRCTHCRRCEVTCPHGIDVGAIVEDFRSTTRKEMSEKERRKYDVKSAYPSGMIKRYLEKGNPYGEDMPTVVELEKKVDIILFPGCVATFEDPHLLEKTEKILSKLGIQFQTVNICCYGGLSAYGYTETDISDLFSKKDVFGNQKIVVLCANCYNYLKHIHAKNVEFITDFIQPRLKKLKLKKGGTFTYHDPCHLVRHNSITASPRALLEAVSEKPVKRLSEDPKLSPCCGGGGSLKGSYALEAKTMAKRIAENTPEGTNLVTGCTFCKTFINQCSSGGTKHVIDALYEAMK